MIGRPSPGEWAALSVLRRAGVAELGWRYRGVRGWMLDAEVQCAARKPVRPALHTLATDELVRRVDVRAPGQNQPLWLYRITEAGLRWATEYERCPARTIRPDHDDLVDRGVFFLRRRLWDALHALQAVHGGPGLRLAEIATSGGPLTYVEVRWLLRAGLMEQQTEAGAGDRPANRYAATPLAMRVRTAAPPGPDWTQLRLHDPDSSDAMPFPSSGPLP